MGTKKDKDKNLGLLLGGAISRENAVIAVDKHTFKILAAKIKDDFCHYGYEVIEGAGLGDPVNVKGTNLIKDEMRDAFAKLRVHLAFIDDVFKYQGVTIKDIDKQHSHELTQLFVVTGFEIKGNDEAETVALFGNKFLSGGSRMELKTPPVAMDSLSSYKWYNELKAAVDAARYEVALYKEGNYTPVKVEEEEEEKDPKLKQGKLVMHDKGSKGTKGSEGSFEEDFENE